MGLPVCFDARALARPTDGPFVALGTVGGMPASLSARFGFDPGVATRRPTTTPSSFPGCAQDPPGTCGRQPRPVDVTMNLSDLPSLILRSVLQPPGRVLAIKWRSGSARRLRRALLHQGRLTRGWRARDHFRAVDRRSAMARHLDQLRSAVPLHCRFLRVARRDSVGIACQAGRHLSLGLVHTFETAQ